MKRVLVVSYVFPPVGGAGVQRISKFVKYLKHFGWEPEVLTTANFSVPVRDQALRRDIPEGTVIHQAITLEPSYVAKMHIGGANGAIATTFFRKIRDIFAAAIRFILTPDAQTLWWPHASMVIIKLLKGTHYDAIFTTGPPFSTLLFSVFWGVTFKIPVIVDFRDEWSFLRQSLENSSKHSFLQSLDRRMEQWVLKRASAITFASPAYKKSILKEYPWLRANKCHVITNGYDEDDFTSISKEASLASKKSEIFNILYAGSVWKTTSLKPFVKVLESVLSERPELREKIRFKIIGRVVEQEQYYFQDLCEQGIVTLGGYLSHDEVIKEMFSADMLLLTLSDLSGAEKIIPGKTFEYMAAGTPVFAVVPEGICASMIARLPGFYVIHPNDTEGMKARFIEIMETTPNYDRSPFIQEYTRLVLTQKLAVALNDVSDN